MRYAHWRVNAQKFATRLVILLFCGIALDGCGGASLEFSLTDAVSGSWVWDATVRIQNRSMREFFQSDRGPVNLGFKGLVPGRAELRVEAPGYESQSIPVTLKRGTNRLAEPVRLRGIEITGLAGWVLVANADGADIVCELRPVRADGTAVLNHPCLPLWVGAVVSDQVKQGIPVQEKSDGSSRGAPLFQGRVSWQWNTTPEVTFRYTARIPGAHIAESAAPYRVVDLLVVVPDQRKIDSASVDSLMAGLWADDRPVASVKAMTAALDARKDSLTWALLSAWNVKARPQ
jgi:hypothetical protein